MKFDNRICGALVFVLVFAFLAAAGFFALANRPPTDTELVRQTRTALTRGDLHQAKALVNQLSAKCQQFPQLLLMVAEDVSNGGDHTAAVELLEQHCDRVVGKQQSEIFNRIGTLQIERGQIQAAVNAFRCTLQREPKNIAALRRLATLYSATGRPWLARTAYFALLKTGAMTVQELATFADPERPVDALPLLESWQKNAPNDALVQSAIFFHQHALSERSVDESQIRSFLTEFPEDVVARKILGERLLTGSLKTFQSWRKSLPESIADSPDILLIQARSFRQQGKLQAAAFFFWKTLIAAPVHRSACAELGQTLKSLGHPAAERFLSAAAARFALSDAIDKVLRRETSRQYDESTLRSICEAMLQGSRLWEAAGWAVLSNRLFPGRGWPETVRKQAADKLQPETPRIADAFNPALWIDLTEWRPDPTVPTVPKLPAAHTESNSAAPHFTAGPVIDFRYENAADETTPGARMYEITGGGVGVLDYDNDGWPDLFFPQGGDWMPGSPRPPAVQQALDALFRNHHGRAFARVTQGGILPGGFGQGCAVADFNADGFPDIFVANIGRNQLYRNHGDGTFSEVTETSGLTSSDWTTSAAFADLNGDSLPDIFEVNYVSGDDVFTRICQEHSCSPQVFDGAHDRVWLNGGDGTFSEAIDATPADNSKGLGIVVARVGPSNQTGIFIANDQVPNFYLEAHPSPHDKTESPEPPGVTFVKKGLASGLAYSADGLAMACMGIAADDANGDGAIDFFVTNFRDEPNTLYLQDSTGGFMDSTAATGLKAPSLPYVGWGTQFLDANNNGLVDLFVANGHVDPHPEDGGYAMPLKLFQNSGNGKFPDVSKTSGAVFRTPIVGRAVAKCDWNRDGREDLVITTLDSGTKLLTNTTEHSGNWIRFHLHGTRSDRDATGSRITIQPPNREPITRQLIAGNGYMASNEHVLTFGLGRLTETDLTIDWPSGTTSKFRSLPTNRSYHLTEPGRCLPEPE